jgi:hypothetical protein
MECSENIIWVHSFSRFVKRNCILLPKTWDNQYWKVKLILKRPFLSFLIYSRLKTLLLLFFFFFACIISTRFIQTKPECLVAVTITFLLWTSWNWEITWAYWLLANCNLIRWQNSNEINCWFKGLTRNFTSR